MDALLIFVVIGAFLIGYAAMSRLDRFRNRDRPPGEPDVIPAKGIFLYGCPETVKALSDDLKKAGVTNDWSAEPEMNAGVHYHWIGAFSDSDEDNLLACLWAMRSRPGIHTIAKCNDMTYKNVFKQTKISVILQGSIAAAQLVKHLKE